MKFTRMNERIDIDILGKELMLRPQSFDFEIIYNYNSTKLHFSDITSYHCKCKLV